MKNFIFDYFIVVKIDETMETQDNEVEFGFGQEDEEDDVVNPEDYG